MIHPATPDRVRTGCHLIYRSKFLEGAAAYTGVVTRIAPGTAYVGKTRVLKVDWIAVADTMAEAIAYTEDDRREVEALHAQFRRRLQSRAEERARKLEETNVP